MNKKLLTMLAMYASIDLVGDRPVMYEEKRLTHVPTLPWRETQTEEDRKLALEKAEKKRLAKAERKRKQLSK